MLSVSLQADLNHPDEQVNAINAIDQIGLADQSDGFPQQGVITLSSGEQLNVNLSVTPSQDNTHLKNPVLCIAMFDLNDHNNTNKYHRMALRLRRYDIVSLTVEGHTVRLRDLGFHTATIIDRIAQELRRSGCDASVIGPEDIQLPAESDQLLSKWSRTLKELLDHPLGFLRAAALIWLYTDWQPKLYRQYRLTSTTITSLRYLAFVSHGMDYRGHRGKRFVFGQYSYERSVGELWPEVYYKDDTCTAYSSYSYHLIFPRQKAKQGTTEVLNDFAALGVKLRKAKKSDDIHSTYEKTLVGQYGKARVIVYIGTESLEFSITPDYY